MLDKVVEYTLICRRFRVKSSQIKKVLEVVIRVSRGIDNLVQRKIKTHSPIHLLGLNFKPPYSKKLDRISKTKLASLVKILGKTLDKLTLPTRITHPNCSFYKVHYLFSAQQTTLTASQKTRMVTTSHRVFSNPDHDQNTTVVSVDNGPTAFLYSLFMFSATFTIAPETAQISFSPPSPTPRSLRP